MMDTQPRLAKKMEVMETAADAILHRLVHNAYRLELKGEFLRKGKGALTAEA